MKLLSAITVLPYRMWPLDLACLSIHRLACLVKIIQNDVRNSRGSIPKVKSLKNPAKQKQAACPETLTGMKILMKHP